MKVLLVNGGPHKNGCTNRALEEVEKEYNSHNTYRLGVDEIIEKLNDLYEIRDILSNQ